MFTLHKLPEGFIITSDETPNEGNTIFNLNNFEVVYNWQGHGSMDWWKKVIAQQEQIIFSALSEEEQTEIGYFNLNKFKIRQWNNHKPLSNDLSTENGFKDGLELGFQKAQELLSDRMFTLEDISKIFVGENEKGGLFDDYLDYRIKTNNKITFKEWYLTQTPSQKSWKIECVEENGKVKILKLLNNE